MYDPQAVLSIVCSAYAESSDPFNLPAKIDSSIARKLLRDVFSKEILEFHQEVPDSFNNFKKAAFRRHCRSVSFETKKTILCIFNYI